MPKTKASDMKRALSVLKMPLPGAGWAFQMVLRMSLSSLTTAVAPSNMVIRLSTVAKIPAAGARAFSIIA